MNQCLIVELGLTPYARALELQQRLVAACRSGAMPDVLLLCEHPHVITLGRSGRREHLLASEHLLRQMNVEVHETNRGGNITYHGPGQLVGYPVVNLAHIRRDVVWYVRQLEQALINASSDFGVVATRRTGMTGVWVSTAGGEEKLGAIGVHISRWVTSHGFAYNVSTDLRYFDLIVPCGIADIKTTSLERLLERPVAMAEVAPWVTQRFGEVFELEMRAASRDSLEEWLNARHAQPAGV